MAAGFDPAHVDAAFGPGAGADALIAALKDRKAQQGGEAR